MNKICGIVFSVMVIAGCSFESPYIGRSIHDFHSADFCRLHNNICEMRDRHFAFHLKLDQGRTASDYVVRGTASWTGPGVYNRQTSGGFNLLLIRRSKIVDDIPFLLHGGIKQKGNIYVEFITEQTFEGMGIGYQIMVGDT